MVCSAKGFSWTPVPSSGATGQAGSTGLIGSSFFFPFPEEKEKENPPSAEGVRGAERLFGGLGSRGFWRWPRMALWPARHREASAEADGPVQGYLSSSLRSCASFARKGLRWI